MIDLATFERTVERLLRPPGDPPGRLLTGDGQPIDRPDDLRRWLSQTTDGRYLPPEDIVIEAIFGRVRLVVTDERGAVLHMGHTQRLYVGALRQAVMLAAHAAPTPAASPPARTHKPTTPDHTATADPPTSTTAASMHHPQPTQLPTRAHHPTRRTRLLAHPPPRRHRNPDHGRAEGASVFEHWRRLVTSSLMSVVRSYRQSHPSLEAS